MVPLPVPEAGDTVSQSGAPETLQLPVKTEQGPGYGAAMLAMVGCGLFPSVEDAADALMETASVTEPEPELTALYEERYRRFRRIYPALRPLFPELL